MAAPAPRGSPPMPARRPSTLRPAEATRTSMTGASRASPPGKPAAAVGRAAPSILDVRIPGRDGLARAWPRGPTPRGGSQLEGRFDTLQSRALGAFRLHGGIAIDPPVGFLDDLAIF